MIPDNLPGNQGSFRIMHSTLIGLPSPCAIRADKFPGVRMGSGPVIGEHCIIFGNVFIGDRFRCGDNVLIRDNTAIGDGVTIGNWSFVDTDVVVADRATIGNEVWIPRSTRIGCGVGIGHNVRLMTEPVDGSPARRSYRNIILEDGCTIGKDAVIGPGVCVGAGASVEAGATVTDDVPPDVRYCNVQ
jgi:UDP-3-O-[3-hydroxymyristoyl] glucosamine N-acyltransferase